MKFSSTSMHRPVLDRGLARAGQPVDQSRTRVFCVMPKGEVTRRRILELSLALASREGLGAITFGRIADHLKISKSCVFAHFHSRDNLVVETLETYWQHVRQSVLEAGDATAPGLPRLAGAFERCLALINASDSDCIFASVMSRHDQQPAAIQTKIGAIARAWQEAWHRTINEAIAAGQLRRDADCAQLVYELTGLLLAAQQYGAEANAACNAGYALRGFARLMEACRPARPHAN